MWPKGRLNTRADDFDLDQELIWQKQTLDEWKAQGRFDDLSEIYTNISMIRAEQYRRKRGKV